MKPLLALCFENIDQNTKGLICSKAGGLGRCDRLLQPETKSYLCTDCASDASGRLCEECFLNSTHVEHNYVLAAETPQSLCHCGNTEVYRNAPPCCIHQIPVNSRSFPAYYIERIRNIIRRSFYYLELLCGDELALEEHVERWFMCDTLSRLNLCDKTPYITQGVKKNVGTANSQKWCLLIFKPDEEDSENVDLCFSFANPLGNVMNLLSEVHMRGFLCVKYRDTIESCNTSCVEIQNFIKDRLPGSGLYCRVMKVYRLFFMKLSPVLIVFIIDLGISKSIFCDLVTEMLFTETSLPEKFCFNRDLWIDIRYPISYHLFMPTLFSKNKDMNLVKFYWQNFERIYNELLRRSDLINYLFRLLIQIVASKRQFNYLVINGFLCKILDVISSGLKRVGFDKGKSLSQVLKETSYSDIDTIYAVIIHFCEILHFPSKIIDNRVQIKMPLKKAAIRFVQFLAEID
ncbi:E3 ubiquitin-protein ligase UBR1 [Thelohanellus kitauei]|uniref:E3 ubiquitin-protein ligase n=1 Tax=Thelohanellus kitauei TaxID=669202 RepID=A0A0C2MKL1_THEKT|nr:E3 ubiquitin-protein ligase UBR1 [Thelohanellus kitauei]